MVAISAPPVFLSPHGCWSGTSVIIIVDLSLEFRHQAVLDTLTSITYEKGPSVSDSVHQTRILVARLERQKKLKSLLVSLVTIT
jgi:hypothetical protein